MSLWEILISDEQYVNTSADYTGTAKTATNAIQKAMKLAKKDHPDCKKLYVSSVNCLGSKDF